MRKAEHVDKMWIYGFRLSDFPVFRFSGFLVFRFSVGSVIFLFFPFPICEEDVREKKRVKFSETNDLLCVSH